MTKIMRHFVWMFFLLEKPEETPYSKALLGITLTLVVIFKTWANLAQVQLLQHLKPEVFTEVLSLPQGILIAGVSTAITWACLHSALLYTNKTNRLVQLLTAFFAIDFILTALLLFWMLALGVAPKPLPKNSMMAWMLVLSFVVMLYWQFMVYIHIINHGLEVSLLPAGLCAFLFMLLQHNVAEQLLNALLRAGGSG